MSWAYTDGWKRWTREEMESITNAVGEDTSLHGSDYREWMYFYFLMEANRDPKQAFMDFVSFAEQFFNKSFVGRPKPEDELSEELQRVRKFLNSLPEGKKATWERFKGYCKNSKIKLPFERSKFYKLKKNLEE